MPLIFRDLYPINVNPRLRTAFVSFFAFRCCVVNPKIVDVQAREKKTKIDNLTKINLILKFISQNPGVAHCLATLENAERNV